MPTSSRPEQRRSATPRALTEADAVDIWIARWLRLRRKDVLARYACDPRRLYEVWEGSRFPRSRAKAQALFRERFPGLVDQVDFSLHRRIPRALPAAPEVQPDLFDKGSRTNSEHALDGWGESDHVPSTFRA